MQNSIYIYIWAWGSSNKLGTLLDSAVVPRVVINQSLTLRRTDLLHKSATICFTFTKTFQIPVQHFYPRNPQAAKKEHSKNPICFQQIHGYTMNLSYCDAKNSSLESPQKNFRASLENRKGWMGRWYQQSRETVGLFFIPWNICLSEILVSHCHRISSNLDFKSCRAHVKFMSPAWWHSTWGQCFVLRMKHLYSLGHVTHEILNTCWP